MEYDGSGDAVRGGGGDVGEMYGGVVCGGPGFERKGRGRRWEGELSRLAGAGLLSTRWGQD